MEKKSTIATENVKKLFFLREKSGSYTSQNRREATRPIYNRRLTGEENGPQLS